MVNRLKRLRGFLRQQGLDGMVISKPENRYYFSGFNGSSGVLLVGLNETRLITDFRYIEQAKLQAPDFTVIRHGSDLYVALEAQIHELGLGRVGFEGDYVIWDSYGRLQQLAGELKAVHLDELRMQKDEHEIHLIRQAVKLADDAFSHILPYLRPGVSEFEVALELEMHMRKNGAEKMAFDIILASGKRSSLPHGKASARNLAVGDFVTMDFGAVFQGYHSDITRTVVIGNASFRQRELYDLVLAAQKCGLAALAPGKIGREVDYAARRLIADAGYADYFGHGLGHGVGLAIHEEPRLSPISDITLAPGMVVTVEPGIYLPEWGGVRIEDTVVVTADGVEILTSSSKDLIEIDW